MRLNRPPARILLCIPALLLFSCSGSRPCPTCPDPGEAFSFAAVGDLPYAPIANGRQVYPAPAYEALIANINATEDIAFTLHVGDIKFGSTLCEDTVYTYILGSLNRLDDPVVYTPGDNEWTDCHRPSNGAMDPLERLDHLRRTFYRQTGSLGKQVMSLEQDRAPYIENASWRIGPALFVTLHQVGSNNNLGRTPAMDREFAARNAANLAFLDARLGRAARDASAKVVVIVSHANPFEAYLPPMYAASGFTEFIDRLRTFVAAHPEKQVLYVHGDSHTHRIDQPLTPAYPARGVTPGTGTPYPNFTRLEVYGAADALAHWVEVRVEANGAFSIVTHGP